MGDVLNLTIALGSPAPDAGLNPTRTDKKVFRLVAANEDGVATGVTVQLVQRGTMMTEGITKTGANEYFMNVRDTDDSGTGKSDISDLVAQRDAFDKKALNTFAEVRLTATNNSDSILFSFTQPEPEVV